ncbi:diphthine--ammonia ligase [Flavobacterium crassostreae]|uniref:ATP-binding protein n=1 Tax=Flavobacterium crassostreae TaxID=1763534 RepID=A0A1B9EA06_9FLAO|nr:diphthine--ammonia ligase [Flavobacterium crassostreae]OCB78784.1 ATP-binding protein [Flavobacterium crassostreae]
MKKKALFNWSSGKDATLALYKILQDPDFEVCTLVTSVNQPLQRISMHGVRVELLHQQAASIGLPLEIMQIPEMPTMEVYEQVMTTTLTKLQQQGINYSIFGDIFLEDLRRYREDKLAILGFKAVFPLWKKPTLDLLEEFLNLGFKTIVVCVNERYLDKSFVGRIIDSQFIADLPEGVDVCGENGEFHTFSFDGPIFATPIAFTLGETVYRKYEKPKTQQTSTAACTTNTSDEAWEYGFWYCDLLPA